jgi:CheY-like chemotaxis protein
LRGLLKVLLISNVRTEWEQIIGLTRANFSGVELVTAKNSGEAMNVVSFDGPFGFFILDVEMKDEDPAELLQNLIELSGERPTLFMGREAFIRDRIPHELYISNEHNDIVDKPIDPEDLKNKMEFALEWAKKKEFESNLEDVEPEDFVPMKLKSFFLYKSFGYDIYMEITSTKYIKLIQADKPYSYSFLANYARRGVKMLYIKKDDQLMYLENESARCLKGLEKFGHNNKEIFVVQLKSINIFHMYYNTVGLTPTVMKLIEALIESIMETYKGLNGFKDIIERYPVEYDGVASKSLLTAYICEAMSKGQKWDSDMIRKKLIISSILQDIALPDEGMTHISKINDDRLEIYHDEAKKDYHDHPIKAAEIARQFANYPDLDFLLEHHHELPSRQGFPYRPVNSKLTVLCGVFNIAQFIAADIDGKSLDAEYIPKLLRSMISDFSAGAFKETLKAAKEWLDLS